MLYIFDKDGTLVSGMGNRPANTPDEQSPLPGVIAKLDELRAAGHALAIASNQGGVAWGFITEAQAQELVRDAAAKVGGADYWRCCCYDERAAAKWFMADSDRPDANAINFDNITRSDPLYFCKHSYRRKPAPGMLRELMRAAGVTPAETIMVGDQESDKQAAERAGCGFVYAGEFFKNQ